MNRFFNMDGPVFGFLNRLADFMILNILFIVCCIPIVTIGASVTAMSYVLLKMQDGEEGYVFRSFLRSFKQNLLQSTIIWVIMLVIAAVIGLDVYLSYMMGGTMGYVVRICSVVGGIFWLMEFIYVFAIQSRFANTVKNTMKNALLLAIANFPKTFLMAVVFIASIIVTFLNNQIFWYSILVWLMFGFAIVAYINCKIMSGIIHKLMPAEESGEVSGETEGKTEEKEV